MPTFGFFFGVETVVAALEVVFLLALEEVFFTLVTILVGRTVGEGVVCFGGASGCFGGDVTSPFGWQLRQ